MKSHQFILVAWPDAWLLDTFEKAGFIDWDDPGLKKTKFTDIRTWQIRRQDPLEASVNLEVPAGAENIMQSTEIHLVRKTPTGRITPAVGYCCLRRNGPRANAGADESTELVKDRLKEAC